MTRTLATLILGATIALTSAAAFAENNSARDGAPSPKPIEQPVTITLDVGVVSGAPDQYRGPWYELRLNNRGH